MGSQPKEIGKREKKRRGRVANKHHAKDYDLPLKAFDKAKTDMIMNLEIFMNYFMRIDPVCLYNRWELISGKVKHVI